MRIPSVLCLVRALWYRIWHLRPISGHSFTETETHEHCCVTIMTCEDCGYVSVTWQPHIGRRE